MSLRAIRVERHENPQQQNTINKKQLKISSTFDIDFSIHPHFVVVFVPSCPIFAASLLLSRLSLARDCM